MANARNTIWITRTQPSAAQTANRLRDLEFEPIIAPLLCVSPPDHMPTRPPQDAVLVFTSKNGVDAFCQLTHRRAWDVVTVGDATARHAQDAGFKDVRSAQGTSKDVSTLIITTYPSSKPVFHATGQHVRGQICEDLRSAGYTAQRAVFYHSTPILSPPDIDYATISTVLLHSPQAARTLAGFAPEIGRAALAQMTTLSISPATDAALGTLNCKARQIAARPTEPAMFDHLPRP